MLLENEAGKAYISMLTTIYVGASSELNDGTNVENRLLSFCSTTMQNFEVIPFLQYYEHGFLPPLQMSL